MQPAKVGSSGGHDSFSEELERHKQIDGIGGRAHLSSLIDGVPERSSVEHYVRILKDKAVLWAAAKWAESFCNHIVQPDASPDTVRQQIALLQDSLDSGALKTPSRIRCWEQIPTLEDLPPGDVDWTLEGIIPAGSVVPFAGESGSYKTWLALSLTKGSRKNKLPSIGLTRTCRIEPGKFDPVPLRWQAPPIPKIDREVPLVTSEHSDEEEVEDDSR